MSKKTDMLALKFNNHVFYYVKTTKKRNVFHGTMVAGVFADYYQA